MRQLAVALAAVFLALAASGCDLTVFGQTTETEAVEQEAAQTIYGKIKEINGNELLLAIGEMTSVGMAEGPGAMAESPVPEGENGNAADSGDRSGAPPAGDQAVEAPSGDWPGGQMEQPSGMPARESRGEAGDAAGGEAATPSRGGGAQGGQMPGQQGITLTGEEVLYQIPVTAEVLSGQGETARAISFTQLAYKNVVQLSLDETGQIFKIEVLQ